MVSSMKTLEQVLVEEVLHAHFGIEATTIIGICEFGSSVYGTTTESSDRDYVVIVDTPTITNTQYTSFNLDIHILSVEMYRNMLTECDILALEVHFNPKHIKEYRYDIELNPDKLRRSISSTVSNSWVKAKKKVILDGENSYIGYKSLFHSIRILDYGIQIATQGKIFDFHRKSYVWKQIMKFVQQGKSIQEMMSHFKPEQNKSATLFRSLVKLTTAE